MIVFNAHANSRTHTHIAQNRLTFERNDTRHMVSDPFRHDQNKKKNRVQFIRSSKAKELEKNNKRINKLSFDVCFSDANIFVSTFESTYESIELI